MNVAVLLATYNSAKYIKEQLDSLYNQTILDWTLYVHDDGSTDDTLSIINEYNKRYHNIIILSPEITHLGPKKNFMFLLNHVSADYYFFCDHDDIWLSDKIENSLKCINDIEKEDKTIPVIFHSDLVVVDKDLNVIDSSMWHYAKIIPEIMHDKRYVMTSCFITGCTLCINHAAKLRIPQIPDHAIMHDWWIGVHAVLNDIKIISSHKQTILYRLHGNNDSGIPKITFTNYLSRFMRNFIVSDYDRKVSSFVREYNISHYRLYKTLLIFRRLLHYMRIK